MICMIQVFLFRTLLPVIMIMWKHEHDPFIKMIPVDSPAFQPMVFKPPGHNLSIHIAVYLPTQGQENEFVDCISKLSLCIDKLQDEHP